MLVVPKKDHKKQLVLEKSAKHAKRRKNLSLVFERKMIRQAKQSIKCHNLSIFLAKRLPKIMKEIQRTEKSLVENYEIRLTTGLELDKQLWRLKTYKHTGKSAKSSVRSTAYRKRQMSTHKARRSISLLFGGPAKSFI